MVDKITQEDALAANIQVHSFLVKNGEYQKSPHFYPENIEKVKQLLERVCQPLPDASVAKAIDFGCGTGFIIDLIKHRFAEVHGVDITRDMMAQVDTSFGNIILHESLAENTPLDDNTFDLATAYSFMDHLFDYKAFLREAFRVLKPGGVFFSDLNPNRDFILAMEQADNSPIGVSSPLVQREVQGALYNGKYYEEQFDLDRNALNTAEPIKSEDKGFSAAEVYNFAKQTGFQSCVIEYEWFLGQGKIFHEQSAARAVDIDNYLSSVLPVASPLYKYLRFIFTK